MEDRAAVCEEETGGAGLENVEWSILLCLMLLHIVDSYDMY